jgi:hypothetical protein
VARKAERLEFLSAERLTEHGHVVPFELCEVRSPADRSKAFN